VSAIEADLQTARLGSRTIKSRAAEANVRALEATLAKADWALCAKASSCDRDGPGLRLRSTAQGEWSPRGGRSSWCSPPRISKVRAFVPEGRVGAIHPGDRVRVFVDGVSEPFVGKVSFISPQAEYTPPVIYSQESRGKLVFMIEPSSSHATAAKLHPGQPWTWQF
jgi:HlyD family secretion protein